jgi:hypothetical protein
MLITATLTCGCAGSQSEQPPSLLNDPAFGSAASPLAYQLNERELKYDCKKLTGVMQVRILQIRDYDPSQKASMVARGVQSVATPIWGGTTAGIDPDGQYRKDLAMLEAYNNRLASKNCKTFDLSAELQGRGPTDMPAPVESKKTP